MTKLTKTQRAALVHLGLHGQCTANEVGDALVGKKLVKLSGRPSNVSLAGASILRSLQRRGMVFTIFDTTTGRTLWSAVSGWRGKVN